MDKPFKPHLACDAKVEKLEFPLWVQNKVDGVRMLVREGVATGRSMKKYKNKRMTEYFSQPCFEGFDMEIGATYENDPDLCRLSTSVVNTIEGKLPAFALIFDYLHPDVIHLEYKDRMEALATYLTQTKLPSEVELIYSMEYMVNSSEDLAEAYASALEANYEGLIIRKQEGLHKSGRCTVKEANYLRMKPTGDSEGVVISVEEAYENLNIAKVNELGHTERSTHKENMKPKGMIGSLWLEDIHSKCVVKIGAGKLTHDERTYYFENQGEIVGQLVKYAFLATGQKDKPRHPRYISHRVWEDMSK
jgi:DNA ligase-1